MTELAARSISQEEQDAFAVLARAALAENRARAQKTINESPHYAEVASRSPELAAFESVRVGLTPFGIASAFLYTKVFTDAAMHFPDGVDLRFEGHAWGLALGGGVLWLGGAMAPSDMLLANKGEVKFVLTTTPTVTDIAFFKENHPVGVVIGSGINVQVGVVGGPGKFTKW